MGECLLLKKLSFNLLNEFLFPFLNLNELILLS
jgi:hypothetical protein